MYPKPAFNTIAGTETLHRTLIALVQIAQSRSYLYTLGHLGMAHGAFLHANSAPVAGAEGLRGRRQGLEQEAQGGASPGSLPELILFYMGCVSQKQGPCGMGLLNKDHNLWGSIVGPLVYGKPHMGF